MLSMLAGLLLFQIALVSPNAAPGASDVLPADLGQWHAALAGKKVEKFSSVQAGAFASATDAAVLNEFGFLGAERREYRVVNPTGPGSQGQPMIVEALRMRDATAAFGAFTWYRQAGWNEDLSQKTDARRFRAAIGPGEAVLQRNAFCIRVRNAAPTHQELAELATALPSLDNEPLPEIGDFLPPEGLVKSSGKYVFGPQVLAQLVPSLPPGAIGFTLGAEAMTGEYRIGGRQQPASPTVMLVLVLYPTPQIAQKYAKELDALNVHYKRTGALISIVPEKVQKSEAEALLKRVHYTMSVMLNQGIRKPIEQNLAQMILGIFELCGILLLFSVLSGLAYGGLRVLFRRKYEGQIFDRDVEVIELRLSR